MAKIVKRVRMQPAEEVETERFCIYCGIWFSEDALVCPNCDMVKCPVAAKRTVPIIEKIEEDKDSEVK